MNAQQGAIAVGFAGVLLMIAPRGGAQRISVGALAAVVAVATYALSVVTLRPPSRTDTTESMAYPVYVLLSIGAWVARDTNWVPLHFAHWPLFIGIGVTGALGQHLITEAFRHVPAAVVVLFRIHGAALGSGARPRDLARAARRRDACSAAPSRDRGGALPAPREARSRSTAR